MQREIVVLDIRINNLAANFSFDPTCVPCYQYRWCATNYYGVRHSMNASETFDTPRV